MPSGVGGAIEEFDLVRFGGPTQVRESQVTVTTAVAQIVRANPDRVELIIMNNGPDALHWGLDGRVTVGTRNQLGSGQQEVFQVAIDGALTGAALFGLVPVGPNAINVIEVTRVRKG